ncbi:MAG: CBS domain-containing protein [Nitrososphaerota archaeon]|nr:CBS domain-containing protein [Nitrososphaerota archaeon]
MSLEDLKRVQIQQLITEPLIVPINTNISSIIATMQNNNAYEVFIEAKGKIGIISVRDLLRVKDITTTKPTTIMKYAPHLLPNAPLSEAATLMTQYRLRALPVVQSSKVKGQITAISIINLMKDYGIKGVKANSIMTPQPITISRWDPLTKARSIMLRRKIDHLPVVEDGRLFGILNSSMIVNNLMPSIGIRRGAIGVESRSRLDFPVDRIADREFVTCNVNEDVSSIIEKMATGRTCTIITLLDEIQGIITQRDIIKLLMMGKEVATKIPIYMVGLPDDPFEAEAAREKFNRVVALLRRSLPSIEEASSVIKSKDVGGRRRYEVSVSLKTPYKTFNYTHTGWELPQIFDELTDRMKRILSMKPKKRVDSQRA